jgi:hypothetical protein
MKKVFISLAGAIILTAVTLFSCKKTIEKKDVSKLGSYKSYFDSENMDIRSMRHEIVALSLDVQKQIFNSLSAEKKALLWHDKLSQVLSDNKFTDYQEQLLKLIDDKISEGVYVVGSDEETSFKEVFHSDWLNKAKGQFVFDELMMIISKLDDYDQNKILIGGGVGDRFDDCECSVKSDWCSFGMSCKIQHCNDSAHGCGTLWTYACRGMCGWN